MHSTKPQKMDKRSLWLTGVLFLGLCLFPGCGGGGGGGDDDSSTTVPTPSAAAWEQTTLYQVSTGGLTNPAVEAAVDSQGRAHILFFEQSDSADFPHAVSYFSWTPGVTDSAAVETVADVDTGNGLAAVALGDQPVVFYQGGEAPSCGADLQGDAMFSLRDGDGWSEYTAAIGYNPRNPYFLDGLAGSQVAAIKDSQGRLHLVYQFYYEGCDAMNYTYPDLRYVLIDPNNPGTAAQEETVEGNDYESTNTQISVGNPVTMVLDSAGLPVVFYQAALADGSKGLRVARKVAGQWQQAWVVQDLEVGHLSAALAADGHLAVAYYVKPFNDGSGDGDFLGYASEIESGWVSTVADDASRCGQDCSLAFNAGGSPVIAYYDRETVSGYARADLKLAKLSGGVWSKETVASTGDIGHFNYLWFNAEGDTLILTYSNTEKTIDLFQKQLP